MMATTTLHVATLLDTYPLHVSVPRSQVATGALHMTRHTEFVIVIDDCGRGYSPRLRRFKNFKWLHDQLRRLQLACALPELPPTKAWGRFDPDFVETRRTRLEEYLKALLLLPSVVQDNTIWSFLDTDTATVAVPRFLCRPSDPAQMLERLKQLKLCVQGDEIFRLCNSAVTADLTAFVRSESAETLHVTQVRMQDEVKLRLQIRVLLCSVVRLLLRHDRAELARQLLVEAGLFGALLALLCRATSEAETLATAAAAAAAGPAAGGSLLPPAVAAEARDLLEKVGISAQECLQSMIERSKGAALLHFCQQDGGLSGLRKLIDTESLHIVAARLLWHGLQHDGVVVALASVAAGGLQLMEKLMGSRDLKARLLASLSLGCMAAHRDALDAAAKQKCFDNIAGVHLPAALDAEEQEAVKRAVEAEAEKGGLGALPGASAAEEPPAVQQVASFSGPAGDARARQRGATSISQGSSQPLPLPPASVGRRQTEHPSSTFPGAGGRPQRSGSEDASNVKPLRKADLVEVLNQLCLPDGLARLQALLCGGVFSPLSLLVVAVLDHFTKQLEERPRLDLVLALAPSLRRFLVETEAPDPEDEAGPEHWLDEGGIHELRVRTARVLVRVAPAGGEGRDADVCRGALRVLELLTVHSEATQVQAAGRMGATKEHGMDLERLVRGSGLDGEPCLARARLEAFGQLVAQLSAQRNALGVELAASQSTSEAILVQLDQFGVKHGVFKTDVIVLHAEVQAQMSEEETSKQAQAVVKEWEEKHSVVQERSRAAAVELDACKSLHGKASRTAHDLECRAMALAQRENELAETCHKAPSIARQLEDRQQDLRTRRASVQEEMQQLVGTVDQVKRRETDSTQYQREAQEALKNVSIVKAELQRVRELLKNEVVHTPDEISELKALELRLQPARPSRLRGRKTGDESPEDTSSQPGGEVDAPAWYDIKAEQSFHSNPNFRALQDLCEHRGKLWDAELRWATETLASVRHEITVHVASHQERRKTDEKTQWEEEQVRRQITEVTDHDGHAKRHQDARQSAAEAQSQSQEAARELSTATGRLKAAEVNLEQLSKEAGAISEELRKALEAASAAHERCTRSRKALEKHCNELQEKARMQLKGWQALRVQECWLELSQRRVEGSIRSEAVSRAGLRAEAHRLIQELQRLDEQLAVEPAAEAEAAA